MIATSHRQYMERIKTLRQHAMSVNDVARHNSSKIIFEEYNELGYNFRMTDIQAAIGIKQLEKLDWIIAERRKIAKAYNEGLKEIECLSLPIEKQDCFSNYQSYAVILKEKCRISRDALMQKLLDLGISTRRGIMLMHREPAYREISGGLSLPISEKLSDRSIILPLYVPMKKEDIDLVINTLKSLLKN